MSDLEKALELFPPRIVVLVSTIDKEGVENVAPHAEFVNLYVDDLMMIIVDDTHDTYKNIMQTKEFVIGLPTLKIAKEVAITGKSFSKEIYEFKESNLTPLKAQKVRAPLIKECMANFECILESHYLDKNCRGIIIGKIIAFNYDKKLIKESAIKTRLESNALLHISKGKIYTNMNKEIVDVGFNYKD